MEGRKHPRDLLNIAGTEERFHLEVYDEEFLLDHVHDISLSGTGIRIPKEVDAGTPLKLVYRTSDYTISVKGMAVWCSPVELGKCSDPDNPSFRIGIQFDPNDRNSPLFFTALRDYIDPFDPSMLEQG